MTIRIKLTIWFIAVILLANAALTFMTVLKVGRVQIEEVQTRVRLDLNSARVVYNNRVEAIGDFLHGLVLSRKFPDALETGDFSALGPLMDRALETGRMDLLWLVGPEGRTVYRAGGASLRGDDLSSLVIVGKALENKEEIQGSMIVPRDILEREGRGLETIAYMRILPTTAARPSDKTEETDAMVAGAALPIFDDSGRLAGVLFGGQLINRRFEIVDAIREETFKHQTYDGKEVGTATIFQGDLRIATNVLTQEGHRAIGTRMSEKVYEKVIERGEVFADRAFVVNDWFITAYEPIRDPAGRIIGALYVGLLERAMNRPQRLVLKVFIPLAATITLVTVVLLFFIIRHLLEPIERIVAMSDRVVQGDLTARVAIRPPGEMGHLCAAIDAMAEAMAEREERLKQATREQIGQSEKLASIGRLAAGVAHEINNPLTGVLTFASLMRTKKNMDEQDIGDLDVIIRETTRVREIVRGLLDFARESPSIQQPLQINEVIANTLRLVRSQKDFRKVTIQERLAENLPLVRGDKNQLQQVVLNLSLNACEAMEGGGTLTITTAAENGRVILRVADSGHGIKPELLDRIFEPFFTTKPVGKGTGLGLSVTYGIIQRHGGTIEIESAEGAGTTFTITLPAADAATDPGGPKEAAAQ